MKLLKMTTTLALCAGLMLSITSCVVFVKKDNGQHKGWFKNPKNPHNPNHGAAKGNQKK